MQIRNLVLVTVIAAAFFSCRKQELREARFSGTWKITRIIRTVYSGDTLLGTTETDYNGTFYFTDRGNSFADNTMHFDRDTAAAVYPAFLDELYNNQLPPSYGAANWNVGPDDAHRLSFVRQTDLAEYSTTVTIKKTAGIVRSWNYYILGTGGNLTREEYIVKRQ